LVEGFDGAKGATQNRKDAQKIAEHYEQAARLAGQGFLAERQVISEIYRLANREELPSHSVEEYLNAWVQRKKTEASPKTYQRYHGIVRRFLDWLGPKGKQNLQHLTSKDLVRYRDWIAPNQSGSSVNLVITVLKAALNQARREGLVDTNEADRVSRVRRNDKHERRAFSAPEIKKLLEIADEEWRGLILAGVYTGARLGDLAGLSWTNVDLTRREIRFKTQKTGRQQILPIADPLQKYLLDLAGSDDPKAPLFPEAYSTRLRDIPTGTLSNRFYRLLVRAGLAEARTNKSTGKGRNTKRQYNELSFHCLRHTATSWLKNAGFSDSVARELMGHESAAISRRYTHIEDQVLRAAVDKMPDVLASDLNIE
jgi:integrase